MIWGEDAPCRVLHLPIPPSTNALWVHGIAGKPRVRSPAYRAWIERAGWQVRQQLAGLAPLMGTFDAEVRVPNSSRRDRNNWDKALFDLLELVGAIRNDSGLRDYRLIGQDRSDVVVALWDRGGPEQPQPPRRQGRGNPWGAPVSPAQIARMRRAGVVV